MKPRYLIPASMHRVESSIRQSRFIASAAHARDMETAKAFIAGIRAEFPKATHNCWAIATGPPGDSANAGMSDDGEPHGTAGRPMLNILLHGHVGEIAVVATRFYGGTKLGTGGLTRAYSGMVKLLLEDLPTREQVETVMATAIIPYPAITLFKNMLPNFEAEIEEEKFCTKAAFTLSLPIEHLSGFSTRLAELTNGQGKIVRN